MKSWSLRKIAVPLLQVKFKVQVISSYISCVFTSNSCFVFSVRRPSRLYMRNNRLLYRCLTK